MQLQPGPGERHHRTLAVLGLGQRSQSHGLQCRVQQRRVQTERLRGHPARQRHLGEHFLAALPGGHQPAKGGPVLHAQPGQPFIQAVHGDRLGTRRWPLSQVK